MSSSTSSGSEDPILEGREGDSHRGDPPDFPQCVQLAIRRGADAMFRAWGVGWRHMNVAVAAEPLLERNEELARIESALAEARTGRGRFVVVEGPGGMGKTALLAVARMTAAEGGMRVLRSRGTELERDFAYGVVRQLFEPSLVE